MPQPVSVQKTITVLVVDDIPLMRTMLVKFVRTLAGRVLSLPREKLELNVLEAGNGSRALDQLEKNDVDLIFLDLMMPEMDGLTFLGHKSQDPRLRDIPVIICSAVGEQNTREQARELGATGYITKPFTLQSVGQKLQEALQLDQDTEDQPEAVT